MEEVVDDEEEGGPCHDIRIRPRVRAFWLEAWDKGQNHDEQIEDIHRDEVKLGASAQIASLRGGQVAQDEPEAEEVEVVRCEDQHEEDWDDLDSKVHRQKHHQLAKKTR